MALSIPEHVERLGKAHLTHNIKTQEAKPFCNIDRSAYSRSDMMLQLRCRFDDNGLIFPESYKACQLTLSKELNTVKPFVLNA